MNIALEKGKTTIARIFGNWVNHDPAKAKKMAEDIISGDNYNLSDHPVGKHEGWIQGWYEPLQAQLLMTKEMATLL